MLDCFPPTLAYLFAVIARQTSAKSDVAMAIVAVPKAPTTLILTESTSTRISYCRSSPKTTFAKLWSSLSNK